MDNINIFHKKLFLKGTKLSLLSTSISKSIEKSNFNSQTSRKNNTPYNKNVKLSFKNANPKNYKKSENKKLSYLMNVKNNFSLNQPSHFQKTARIKMLKKNKSAENIFSKEKDIKNKDLLTQRKIFSYTVKKIKNIRLNFFKNLIDKIPQKGLEDIDYVLESPFRGEQKISLPFFLKNQAKSNKGFYDLNNLCLSNNKNSYLLRDKYNEIKKEKIIDNPLGRISKISGISSYKLRQAINYSLRNNFKNFTLSKNEQKEFLKQINKFIYKNNNANNKYKKNYEKIGIKLIEKDKFDKIKDSFIDLNDENIIDNVILSKRGNKLRNQ